MPKTKMQELASPQRLLAVPAPLRDMPRAEEKGIGYSFVGREQERVEIFEVLGQHGRSRAGGESSGAFAVLVHNAPGVGKTALLDQVAIDAREREMACVQLRAGNLLSPETMLDAIQSSRIWRNARSIARALEVGLEVAKLAPLAATAAGQTELGDALDLDEVAVQATDWEDPIAQRIAEILAKQPGVKTVMDALGVIDRANQGGWILSVDECQKWDRHVSNSFLPTIIEDIADPTARETSGLSGGGLLLAGLTDSDAVIEELGLTRYHPMQLKPLPEAECAKAIEAEVYRSSRGGLMRPEYLEFWGWTLAEDFNDWTLHARCAAVVSRKVIDWLESDENEDEIEADDDTAMDWSRTIAARQVVEWYEWMVSRVVAAAPRGVARVVGALADTTGNAIPNQALQSAIANGVAIDSNFAEGPETYQRVKRQLQRKGLIARKPSKAEAEDNIWEVPIQSLVSHMAATMQPDSPSVQQARSILDGKPPGTG